jgi:hypothetical protein
VQTERASEEFILQYVDGASVMGGARGNVRGGWRGECHGEQLRYGMHIESLIRWCMYYTRSMQRCYERCSCTSVRTGARESDVSHTLFILSTVRE